MALIKCKKCGKLISDVSDKCPFCDNQISPNRDENSYENRIRDCVNTILFIILLIIISLVLYWIVLAIGKI